MVNTMRVFDYDGDGRSDLLGFQTYGDGLWHIYKSTGRNFVHLDTGIAQEHLHLADVNGDGLQDAVVESAGKFAVRLNKGGSFDSISATNVLAGEGAKNLRQAQVLDFNSDGRQDLLAPFGGVWHFLRARPLGVGFDDVP